MKQRSQPNQRNRAFEHPSVDGVHIRTATVDDAAAIAEIYNQGIEDRAATYETKRRSAEDQRAWLQTIADRYPAVVAQVDDIAFRAFGLARNKRFANLIGRRFTEIR